MELPETDKFVMGDVPDPEVPGRRTALNDSLDSQLSFEDDIARDFAERFGTESLGITNDDKIARIIRLDMSAAGSR